MKKIITVSLFTLLLVFSFNAYSAEKGWYISDGIGLSMLDDSVLFSFDEADMEEITGEDLPAGSRFSSGLKYNKGFVIGVALGYDFGDYRLESEFTYQRNDHDKRTYTFIMPGEFSHNGSVNSKGNVSSYTLLFNGYYDIFKWNKFRPYITGGIGLAKAEKSDFGYNADDTVFAYQAGVGISYEMFENTTLDLKYRYFRTSDPDLFPTRDQKYSSDSVILGFRFYF